MDGRQHHQHHHLSMNASRQQHDATAPAHLSQRYSHYPTQGGIDASAISASVQRFLPSNSNAHLVSNAAASTSQILPSTPTAYISLPPGVDPATVDFRTFYPYNPSEVKHRKRTTRNQLKLLEETFKRETKPNAALRKTLAAQLEMTPRGVQVWFQNRRAKEKSLAKKLLSGDKRTTSTSVPSASPYSGNRNEGNDARGDASSLPASARGSAPESASNDPDARNLLDEDGNFDQSAAQMISSGNANVDLVDDDLDLDVGDEEREISPMKDDAAFDEAVKRELGVSIGATPSPSSTSSDLVSTSRVSLPTSSTSSPSSSANKHLTPSPKDKTKSPLGAGSHQSLPIKRDEENSEGLLPSSAATNGDDGASLQRTSWHGSSGQTPTMMSSILPSHDASNGTQLTDQQRGELADLRSPPNNDLRRPSLPTHLNLTGLGLRGANGHHSGPPTSFRMPGNGVENGGASSNDNVDSATAMPPRPTKSASSRVFDPTATRRLSLDRLASHPYAHLTLQANGAVYGQQGLSMYRRASAFAGSGQHFNVGYGGRGARHGHGSPFAVEQYHHWQRQRRNVGSEFGPIGEVRTPQAGAVDLPSNANSSFDFSEPTHEDGQLESMRHGSLPGDAFVDPHQQFSAGQQQHQQLFPREGHMYALPRRDYAPPSSGPLPAADFSFGTGTVSSSAGVTTSAEGADDNANNTDASAQGHNDVASTLAGYTFPQGSSTSSSSAMPPPSNEDIAPLATTGPLGNPFGAPRFGSIASVVSEMSEYEYGSSSETSVSTNTSAGSGPYMQSDTLSADAVPRRGSVFGYDFDGRRPSYTGQISDMLSNLDVHNGSNSSLSHEGAPPSLSASVPFSQTSELAFALSHRKENVGASGNNPPPTSAGHSPGSDMDVSVSAYASSAGVQETQPILDQEPIAFNPRQSFSNSSTGSSLIYPLSLSAASSSSSLNVGAAARLSRNQHRGHMQHSSLGLQIPADEFMCSDIDEVSGTGHYSPVSPPNPSGAASVYGLEFAQTGSGSSSLLSQHPLSQSSVPVYDQSPPHSQGSQGEVYGKMQGDLLSPQNMQYAGDVGQNPSSENQPLSSPFYN